MASAMGLRTVAELYPAAISTDLNDLLYALLTDQKDRDGRPVIRRCLSQTERDRLLERQRVLERFLVRGSQSQIAGAVARLLSGFEPGKNVSESDSQVIVAQYAFSLKELPIFAIERACTRFATGSVTPVEIGAKHIDVARAPSSASIAMIARELIRPLQRELTRIAATLRGVTVPLPVSEEQRLADQDRIAASLEEFKASQAQEDDTRRRELAEGLRARALDAVLEDYRRAGIEPPTKGVVMAIPTLLHMGFKIEEIGGRNVLVGPGGRA